MKRWILEPPGAVKSDNIPFYAFMACFRPVFRPRSFELFDKPGHFPNFNVAISTVNQRQFELGEAILA